MKKEPLQLGNEIVGYGVITEMTETMVRFGAKGFRKTTILTEIQFGAKVIYKESPDPAIDWRNGQQVDEYYLTFKDWAGRVRVGDSKTRELLEVKNNKVFHNGEYYLPINNKEEKLFLPDGFIFGYCLKIHNAFYSYQNNITVNVFWLEQPVSIEEKTYSEEKIKNRKLLNPVEYLKTLDLNCIDSFDLGVLKEHFKDLFDKTIFPYTTESKVTFQFGNFNRIQAHYRNRQGYLEIDNGYKGSMPFANDYDAILKCAPYFTNEHSTYTRVEDRVGKKELTFDKAMLDLLASRIVTAWDRAIELNFRIYG